MKKVIKLFALTISVFAFAGMAIAEDAFVIGSIGDSITKAFNSKGILDRPWYSWSSGYANQSESHYNQLKKIYENVERYNFARTGAIAVELAGQVQRAIEKKVDYVTILMGANDVCHWNQNHFEALETFKTDYINAIESLISANSNIKILVVPIPNMVRMWEVGIESNRNCSAKWKRYRICQNLLGKDVSDLERQQFAERLEDANAVITEIAYSYPEHVVFVEKVATTDFKLNHISSIDCFHPSLEGQNFLAEETWKEGWYQTEN